MAFSRLPYAGVILAGLALAPLPARAADPEIRNVQDFSCKDVLRESGTSREIAIAFLHGYTLAKSGNSKVDIESMAQQTDAFIDACLDKGSQKALDVMVSVKK